jgi:DNA-3-methyladenine glycosylase I
MKERCHRCLKHPDYIRYHDEERWVPMHDEGKHFEFLLLETMQAWLSRWTILQRRENYRKAFAWFDPKKIAKFDEKKVEELMQNAGIIRNQAKIRAAIKNAQAFLQVQKEFGSFDAYIRSFSKGRVVDNKLSDRSQFVATSGLSDAVSKDMKKRWFSFVWSTTIYAHLQAIGVINDHLISCFRYKEISFNKESDTYWPFEGK